MRPAVKLKDTSSYTLEDLESYRCSQVRTVAITSLDPSMVLGFYCRNQHDFEDFCVEAIKSTVIMIYNKKCFGVVFLPVYIFLGRCVGVGLLCFQLRKRPQITMEGVMEDS